MVDSVGVDHDLVRDMTEILGKRAGKRVGFPRFKKKGRDGDRVCFTTGAMRVEPDRRHLTLPVIGTVRTHENTRRIERLIRAGRARVLAISVRRNGTRLDASVRVVVQPWSDCPCAQIRRAPV